MRRSKSTNLIWALGHQGLQGNESANKVARALSPRVISLSLQLYSQSDNLALSFKDITPDYYKEYRRYPDPCKRLYRTDDRLLIKILTNTVLCLAVFKHFNPSFNGACQFCLPHCLGAPNNPTYPSKPQPGQRGLGGSGPTWLSRPQGQKGLGTKDAGGVACQWGPE